MPWKTGSTPTLTSSGTFTGSLSVTSTPAPSGIFAPSVPGPDPALNGEAGAFITIACAGGGVTGGAGVTDTGTYNHTGGGGPYTISGDTESVSASAFGSGPPDSGTGDTAGGSGASSSVTLTGTWSVSIDCEEVMDFTIVEITSETDHGVFVTAPRAILDVYLIPLVGGKSSAAITYAGLSASQSKTLVTADASTRITQLTQVGASIGDASGNASTLSAVANGGGSLDIAWSDSPVTDCPSQTKSCSTSFSSASASGGTGFVSLAASSSVSWTGMSLVSQTQTQSNAGALCFIEAQPLHSFVIDGACFTPGDSYPSTVDLICSRYAGDPSPGFTAGSSWSRSYSQHTWTLTLHTTASYATAHDGEAPDEGDTQTADYADAVNEFQDLTASVDSTWCATNGEQVTYPTSDTTTATLYDDVVYLHGYTFAGVTLAQAASITVDDCTSSTGWTNATHGTGGLHNTAAGPMVRTGDFDYSGYRYLRCPNTFATAAGTATASLGGKTYAAPVTTTAGDVVFDLMNPVTGGAASDTLETKWPLDADAKNVSNGPLRGISLASTLSLGVASGTLTVGSIEQVRQDSSTAHFLSGYAPRNGTDTPEETPPVAEGTDLVGTATPYAHRGLICTTDSRPSLEYADSYFLHIEPPDGPPSWAASYWPISDLVTRINAGDPWTGPALSSGSMGFAATALAPADDSSDNLRDGFLNRDRAVSSAWLCYGWHLASFDAGWTNKLGLDCTGEGASVPCQVLCTTLKWWAGCGDVFGLAPSGYTGGAIHVGASKGYRSEALPVVIIEGGGDASGKAVEIAPAAGELQAVGVAVGSGTTDTQGGARTTGAGLIGYTGGSPSEMVFTDTSDG